MGKISFVAHGGGHGIKFSDDENKWYNPVDSLIDNITPEFIGRTVEIRVLEDGKHFDNIIILDGPTSEEIEETTKTKTPTKKKKILRYTRRS